MKRIIFIVVGAILAVLAVLVVFFTLAFKPIDREGTLNLIQDNTNSQIAKAVGRNEVKHYLSLLEFLKYPRVDMYSLSRDKNFDHDWRSISFNAKDNFDNVSNFYKSQFPTSEPVVETRGGPTEVYQYDEATQKGSFQKKYVIPYRTAQFRIQPKPGKVGRSFLLFETYDPGLAFRIDITENKQAETTSVTLTSF